jgi:hypothetical protein
VQQNPSRKKPVAGAAQHSASGAPVTLFSPALICAGASKLRCSRARASSPAEQTVRAALRSARGLRRAALACAACAPSSCTAAARIQQQPAAPT